MTDSQLLHPAFLLSLDVCLQFSHGYRNWLHPTSFVFKLGLHILSLCPVFHAFCVLFLFSIPFPGFIIYQYSVLHNDLCSVSSIFFCPEYQVHLVRNRWHSQVAHQRADSDIQSSLPALYFGNREYCFRTAESLIKKCISRGPGDYTLESF